MTSSELRDLFLKYFKEKNHSIISSSPLIPMGDPSLLFTTAGMVQFKPMFAGEVDLRYTRAASCQKCFRTSDLENVGKTPRHHTFFEMLGNFSFGDYFKKSAIEYAWDFSVKIVKLDPKRIYISIYLDDDEAYDIWTKHIGLSKDKIVRLGKKDNFWGPAGETGACGPCSELYYDLGENMLKNGDDPSVGGDNNRYIEYWNLVFNQFNQQSNGELIPLPKTGIDTGMGLERLSMISQNVQSVYDTDLFKPYIDHIISLSKSDPNEQNKIACNVIADHIRGATFLLAENILPSNDGRGYVIRRILRRAIRFGKAIGFQEPFLYKLIPVVAETMSKTYSELNQNSDQISKIIKSEEKTFFSTLEEGSNYLDQLIHQCKEKNINKVSGQEAFKLYDSMGFPLDLTIEIASENNLQVETETYNKLMEDQRKRGRAGIKEESSIIPEEIQNNNPKTIYTGETDTSTHSNILYILKLNENSSSRRTDSAIPNGKYILITEKSPFYGESGGQIGDTGTIHKDQNDFVVQNTTKWNDLILHHGEVRQGSFKTGDPVNLTIDTKKRMNITRNHSATHLLQKALQKILGSHIRQLGSLVNDEKLRFDFSHYESITQDKLTAIEKEVNKYILQNNQTNIEIMDKDTALSKGALAFFGDKYDHSVRTVHIGDSFELCGGSHVKHSGDIGSFKIISESSISSGTRRIEAITGEKAIELFHDLYKITKNIETILNTSYINLSDKISNLIEKNKSLEKELNKYKTENKLSNIEDLIKTNLNQINNIPFISLTLENTDLNDLKKINDKIKNGHQSIITLLFSISDDKIFYLCSVSKDLIQKNIKADEIIKQVSTLLNGKGGGKEMMAQGSSPTSNKIENVSTSIKDYIINLF